MDLGFTAAGHCSQAQKEIDWSGTRNNAIETSDLGELGARSHNWKQQFCAPLRVCSLEHYLLTVLQNQHGKTFDEYTETLAQIPIRTLPVCDRIQHCCS
jgi:hypothetical protein